jgi:hypothetical protein
MRLQLIWDDSEIAAERFAAWRAELRAERSARQSIRIARTERDLEQMLVHAKRDEQAILATRGLTDLADALADDGEARAFHWPRTRPRG